MFSSSRQAILAFAALAAFSSSSFAALIAPGGFIPIGVEPPVIGGILLDSDTENYVGKNATAQVVFTGSETSQVFANDAANPFGLGALTFTYTLSNDLTSPDSVDRISVSNFLGYLTDVSFAPVPGIAPTFADRTANGDTVGFDFFGGSIVQGATTTTLIIRTNATAFTPNTLSVIDGGTGVVPSIGPIPQGGGTPEPASLGILGAGALIMLRRRR